MKKLSKFQQDAAPFFQKYGIQILHQYSPIKKGQIGIPENIIEQPDIIQVFRAKSMDSFQSYLKDETIQKLSTIRNSGLRKMSTSFGMELSEETGFPYTYSNNLHGIALVKYNNQENGLKSIIDFNKKGYTTEVFQKYGIHCESIVPIDKTISSIGEIDYNQPDAIITFGMDDPLKMPQYLSDPEYISIAPIRDNVLSEYYFFICR